MTAKKLILESDFKKAVVDNWKSTHAYASVFCIESEETVPGFPDVLAIGHTQKTELFEFKASDAKGIIKFQRTQPLFYKNNMNLDITVAAYNNKDGTHIYFPVLSLFCKGDGYCLNSKNEVQL